MSPEEAFEIVLDLAHQNVLESQDDDMIEETERQEEALSIAEKMHGDLKLLSTLYKEAEAEVTKLRKALKEMAGAQARATLDNE